MSCPQPDVLTTYASLTSPATPGDDSLSGGDEIAEDWTRSQLESHLDSCPECEAHVAAWRHSLERWAEVDILDRDAWSGSYFAQLQEEIETGLWGDSETDTEPVVDLAAARRRRQQTFALVASLAAMFLLGLLLQQRSTEQASEGAQLTAQNQDLGAGEAVEAEGRALGRALLASLNEEDLVDSSASSTPVWGIRGLLEDDGNELGYFFNNDYHDALDGLDGDSADALIERL